MSFLVAQPKQVSQWEDYLDDSGKKLAEVKICGIKCNAYQVKLDRINSTYEKGDNIDYKGEPLTHNHAIFLAVAEHLILDWDGVSFDSDGEKKEVGFSVESAFNLMRWGAGLSGAMFAGFVIGKAQLIQNNADNYKEEVLGKSEASTDGKNTEKKPAKSQRNKPTSTNG